MLGEPENQFSLTRAALRACAAQQQIPVIFEACTGQFLEWDGAQMRFTNEEKANQLVKEPRHNGWSLDT